MTKAHVSHHPLVRTKVTELRDKRTPPHRFRKLVRDLSVLLMYEAMNELETVDMTVETPLATTTGCKLAPRIGLMPVMRAGIPMNDAILDVVEDARSQHIGMSRNEKTLSPEYYYDRLATTSDVDIWYVLDPMLATGGSAVATVATLKERGAKRIAFIGLIAAPEGVELLTRRHPDVRIHVAALDERLNEKGYILPGLGDAGDRIFGTL